MEGRITYDVGRFATSGKKLISGEEVGTVPDGTDGPKEPFDFELLLVWSLLDRSVPLEDLLVWSLLDRSVPLEDLLVWSLLDPLDPFEDFE